MSDSDRDFDRALTAAAFRLAADSGWDRMTVAGAAREAGLSLATARERFPGKRTLLRRFGEMLDRAALEGMPQEGPVRDGLFDLLMNRFEAMKPHREGLRALMRALPGDPATALELTWATKRSLGWMLEAVGDSPHGLRGALRLHGLMAVWAWVFRTFQTDESEDLSATMAALDKALAQAHEAAAWLGGRDTPVESDAVGGDAAADEMAEPPLA